MASFVSLHGAAAVAAALGLTAAPSAQAADYTFTVLAASDGLVDPFGFGAPVLNDSGVAAFNMGWRNGLEAIVRSDGITRTIIASDRTRFSRFGDLSINAAGQVAFEAGLRNVTGEGIFSGSGGAVTQIAGTRDAGDFDFVRVGPSINARATVAFSGERIVGSDFVDGVYVGRGAGVNPVYDETGAFRNFSGNPAINDSGQVAFLADIGPDRGGLAIGRGGAFQVLADDRGLLVGTLAWSDPSLNDHGDVAFSAGTNEDFDDNGSATGAGVFVVRNGVLQTVLQGGFDTFFSFGDVSLNNRGSIAFTVEPEFGVQVLATGADLVADRVIGTGDTLFGRSVSGVLISREGLNDSGQIAFEVFFANGDAAVVLATPLAALPEPRAGLLLAAGLAAIAAVGRRRLRSP